MTDILSDERLAEIRAAANHVAEQLRAGVNVHMPVRASDLRALLARLDKAEAGWRVRPLQWVEVSPGSWMAHGIGLDYVVCDRQWWQGAGASAPCADDDAAKIAAEADYEQRIRSAFLPHPPSSES